MDREARAILNDLLDKYAEHGLDQLKLPDVLKLPPLSSYGNPSEIAVAFGGPTSFARRSKSCRGFSMPRNINKIGERSANSITTTAFDSVQ